METRRLSSFIAIVDSGSLTRAAERMKIAQPALSQQLAALEATYGAQLLIRHRQGVTMTRVGQVLYRHAQTILRQMKQMEAELSAVDGQISGDVAVGVPVSCAPILSLPLLRATRERYPQIGLRVSENLSCLLGELLSNNRLDTALLYNVRGHQELIRWPLFIERLCLVTHPGLMSHGTGDSVSVKSLAELPLVLPSHSYGLRALVDAAFARHGLVPHVVAEIDSLHSLRAAAEDGLGATILPRSATGPDMPTLHVIDLVEPCIERMIGLCTPAMLAAPEPVKAIQTLLIDVSRELVHSGRWRGVRLQ